MVWKLVLHTVAYEKETMPSIGKVRHSIEAKTTLAFKTSFFVKQKSIGSNRIRTCEACANGFQVRPVNHSGTDPSWSCSWYFTYLYTMIIIVKDKTTYNLIEKSMKVISILYINLILFTLQPNLSNKSFVSCIHFYASYFFIQEFQYFPVNHFQKNYNNIISLWVTL